MLRISLVVSRISDSTKFLIDNVFGSFVMTSANEPTKLTSSCQLSCDRLSQPYRFCLWGWDNKPWHARVACNSCRFNYPETCSGFAHYSAGGKIFFLNCLIGLSNLVLYTYTIIHIHSLYTYAHDTYNLANWSSTHINMQTFNIVHSFAHMVIYLPNTHSWLSHLYIGHQCTYFRTLI